MPRCRYRFFDFRLIAFSAMAAAFAGCATLRPAVDPAPAAPPAFEPERLLKMGTVLVDADARMVVATGFVNQVSDAIELLICGPGGKTHESAFVMQAHALDLQTALLLLGLEPGPPRAELGEGPPRGPTVDIWVQWEDESGATHAHPAETFAAMAETGKELPRTGWAFTGSVIQDGRFMALAEESFAATYWDPWAILNILHEVGADDEALAVNRKRIPPLGTPVRFLLVPRK